MGPIPEIGSVWQATDRSIKDLRGGTRRVVVVDTSGAIQDGRPARDARVTVQRLWANGRLGKRWTTPLPMTIDYTRTNEHYALGVANLRLSSAREAALRAVGRGEVTRDFGDDDGTCWDKARAKKVTVQVDALIEADLVADDFSGGRHVALALTKKGQIWLDTHPVKED